MISFSKRTFPILIFFTTLFSFGQVEVELFFYDACKDSIIQLEYEVMELLDSDKNYISKNYIVNLREEMYFLTSGIERIEEKTGLIHKMLEVENAKKSQIH